uniref:RRM domain-containing protein n=1 Tax=Tanacetum cinerariifolium TaxID=118510 RepID=A0A6L2JGF8_TANCI|nr:hypothetical protein [Tanacetum cinerariifolium]
MYPRFEQKKHVSNEGLMNQSVVRGLHVMLEGLRPWKNYVVYRYYGVGVSISEVDSLVASLGCTFDSIPFIYLGLSVGKNMSLPIYYISLFKAPILVINTLESLRRRLVTDTIKKGQNSSKTGQNRAQNGKREKVNSQSLLGKWKWRFHNEKEAILFHVISEFYGEYEGFSSLVNSFGLADPLPYYGRTSGVALVIVLWIFFQDSMRLTLLKIVRGRDLKALYNPLSLCAQGLEEDIKLVDLDLPSVFPSFSITNIVMGNVETNGCGRTNKDTKALWKMFEKYGNVEDVYIAFKRTKKNTSFGLLSLKPWDDKEPFTKKLTWGCIDGLPIQGRHNRAIKSIVNKLGHSMFEEEFVDPTMMVDDGSEAIV